MKRLLLLFTAFVSPFLAVHAQAPLTLSEALQFGLQNNFQIRISRANEQIATNNNSWGEAGALPSVSASLPLTNSFFDQDNPASFLNGTYSNHVAQLGVDMNWTLFAGFSAQISKEQLRLLEEQSHGNAALIVENTLQSIILAYYNSVVQEKRLNTFETVKRVSRDEYRYFQERVELGASTTFDMLQAKDGYLTDSTNYINQELAARSAKRDLNVLLAFPEDTAFILVDTVMPKPEVFNYELLREQVLQANRQLKNEYINVLLKEQAVQAQRAGRYPSLDIAAGASDAMSWFILDGDVNRGEVLNYYVNFSLGYNLYNGGRVNRAIENAIIERDIANLTIEEQQQTIEAELRTQYEAYTNRVRLLGVTKQSLDNAALNLELGESRYQNGSITSFDYRDIQVRYVQASLTMLETAYDLLTARTELIRLSGELVSVPANAQ